MAESAGKMYALATVLTILAIVAVMLRFQARRIKQTALSWDDYLILPALLFTIGTAICMFIGTASGNLGRHTGTNSKDLPIFDHRLRVFEQIFFASQLTQTLTFGFTKLSVILFYKRIFRGKNFTISFWVMITITIIWTVAFLFYNMFQCIPIWINWTGFGSVPGYCFNTSTMYLAQAWSDVLTDAIILSLPPPFIWKLHMSTQHKLGISGIFLLGALTVGAGIAKAVVFQNTLTELSDFGALDISYVNTPLVYWPMVECSLGIVGSYRMAKARSKVDQAKWEREGRPFAAKTQSTLGEGKRIEKTNVRQV